MPSLIDTMIAELKKSAEAIIHNTEYHHIRDGHYYSSYSDNLYCGCLSDVHKASFSDAQGGELLPKRDKPAKMSAIRSSSALAVNIFGKDRHAQIKDNQINLPAGKFDLKYEETAGVTITSHADGKSRPHYANIDVRLTKTDEAEIFIEVKMLEPLSFSPKINEAYVYRNNYNPKLGPELIEAFVEIFKQYNTCANDKSMDKYSHPAYCFDSCQMFKHLLAILDLAINDELKSKNVFLVNCHWDFQAFPPSKIQSHRSLYSFKAKCDQYKAAKEEYERIMERLKETILAARILDNLTIVNCTHKEMIEALELKTQHRQYLERYSINEGP